VTGPVSRAGAIFGPSDVIFATEGAGPEA